jgi:hypothetical protein
LIIRINDTIEKIKGYPDNDSIKKGLEKRRDDILKILYNIDVEDNEELRENKIGQRINVENKSINELYKDELGKILKGKDFIDIENQVYKIPRKKHDNKYTRQFRNFKNFYEKLDKDSTGINNFAKTFLDRCQVIEIKSWDVEQAIVMFNTLNSDALPLSDTDIISAQLFAKSEDKKDFNEQWENINKLSDELNNKKVTDLEKILNQYMYIDRANKEITDVTLQGLRKYYLNESNNLISNPDKLCKNIQKIIDNWFNIIDRPIVRLALKFNENIKTFLSCYLYGHQDFNDDKLTKICESLIRLFAIMEVVDSSYSTNN